MPVAAEHRAQWEALYAGYAAFYRVEQTPQMRETVWTWLSDPDHEVEGFVALDGTGRVVGLAHFRPFARPLSATTGGFLAAPQTFSLRSLKAFPITDTELKLIAAAAIIGESRSPNAG